MQNLLSGMTWGKKMSSKQFEQVYERMMHKKRKKEAEIEKRLKEKKSKELDGCTFKPDLETNKRSVSRKKTTRPSKSETPRTSGGKGRTEEEIQKAKKIREAREAKFLERIEEMKRRDEQRKQRTLRKYKEMQRENFEKECTFQPNKKKKSRKPRKKRGDLSPVSYRDSSNQKMVHKKIEPVKNKTTENQNFAGEKSNENVAKSFKHVRDQSGIVLGIDELLGSFAETEVNKNAENSNQNEGKQEEKEENLKVKIKKEERKKNAFLERMEKYQEQKKKKEKEIEEMKKMKEEEELKKYTFQPNKNRKKSRVRNTLTRSHNAPSLTHRQPKTTRSSRNARLSTNLSHRNRNSKPLTTKSVRKSVNYPHSPCKTKSTRKSFRKKNVNLRLSRMRKEAAGYFRDSGQASSMSGFGEYGGTNEKEKRPKRVTAKDRDKNTQITAWDESVSCEREEVVGLRDLLDSKSGLSRELYRIAHESSSNNKSAEKRVTKKNRKTFDPNKQQDVIKKITKDLTEKLKQTTSDPSAFQIEENHSQLKEDQMKISNSKNQQITNKIETKKQNNQEPKSAPILGSDPSKPNPNSQQKPSGTHGNSSTGLESKKKSENGVNFDYLAEKKNRAGSIKSSKPTLTRLEKGLSAQEKRAEIRSMNAKEPINEILSLNLEQPSARRFPKENHSPSIAPTEAIPGNIKDLGDEEKRKKEGKVDVDAIVAGTTANVLMMLKQNPKMLKELLGADEKEEKGKSSKKRKGKNIVGKERIRKKAKSGVGKTQKEVFTFNSKYRNEKRKNKDRHQSEFDNKSARGFQRTTITSDLKKSYFKRINKRGKPKNMTQRKEPSKTAKFYQTKKKNLKILKNLNYSGVGPSLGNHIVRKRKKVTATDKFKKDFKTGSKTERRKRDTNFENEKDFLKKKLAEMRGERTEEKEDIGSLEESLLVTGFDTEIDNLGFKDIPAVQTLDPATVKRLQEEVQKIRLEDTEGDIEKKIQERLTKTLDWGPQAHLNVARLLDSQLHHKRMRTPNKRFKGLPIKKQSIKASFTSSKPRTKDFEERNREYIRKKEEEQKAKMKRAARKSVSRSRTDVKKLKSKIKNNPVPTNAKKRGKVGKKRRKEKEKELGVGMNIIAQTRGLKGAIMDPRGPKIDLAYGRSKSLMGRSKISKKRTSRDRQSSNTTQAHPAIKYLLKPLSARKFGAIPGITTKDAEVELKELIGEKIEISDKKEETKSHDKVNDPRKISVKREIIDNSQNNIKLQQTPKKQNIKKDSVSSHKSDIKNKNVSNSNNQELQRNENIKIIEDKNNSDNQKTNDNTQNIKNNSEIEKSKNTTNQNKNLIEKIKTINQNTNDSKSKKRNSKTDSQNENCKTPRGIDDLRTQSSKTPNRKAFKAHQETPIHNNRPQFTPKRSRKSASVKPTPKKIAKTADNVKRKNNLKQKSISKPGRKGSQSDPNMSLQENKNQKSQLNFGKVQDEAPKIYKKSHGSKNSENKEHSKSTQKKIKIKKNSETKEVQGVRRTTSICGTKNGATIALKTGSIISIKSGSRISIKSSKSSIMKHKAKKTGGFNFSRENTVIRKKSPMRRIPLSKTVGGQNEDSGPVDFTQFQESIKTNSKEKKKEVKTKTESNFGKDKKKKKKKPKANKKLLMEDYMEDIEKGSVRKLKSFEESLSQRQSSFNNLELHDNEKLFRTMQGSMKRKDTQNFVHEQGNLDLIDLEKMQSGNPTRKKSETEKLVTGILSGEANENLSNRDRIMLLLASGESIFAANQENSVKTTKSKKSQNKKSKKRKFKRKESRKSQISKQDKKNKNISNENKLKTENENLKESIPELKTDPSSKTVLSKKRERKSISKKNSDPKTPIRKTKTYHKKNMKIKSRNKYSKRPRTRTPVQKRKTVSEVRKAKTPGRNKKSENIIRKEFKPVKVNKESPKGVKIGKERKRGNKIEESEFDIVSPKVDLKKLENQNNIQKIEKIIPQIETAKPEKTETKIIIQKEVQKNSFWNEVKNEEQPRTSKPLIPLEISRTSKKVNQWGNRSKKKTLVPRTINFNSKTEDPIKVKAVQKTPLVFSEMIDQSQANIMGTHHQLKNNSHSQILMENGAFDPNKFLNQDPHLVRNSFGKIDALINSQKMRQSKDNPTQNIKFSEMLDSPLLYNEKKKSRVETSGMKAQRKSNLRYSQLESSGDYGNAGENNLFSIAQQSGNQLQNAELQDLNSEYLNFLRQSYGKQNVNFENQGQSDVIQKGIKFLKNYNPNYVKQSETQYKQSEKVGVIKNDCRNEDYLQRNSKISEIKEKYMKNTSIIEENKKNSESYKIKSTEHQESLDHQYQPESDKTGFNDTFGKDKKIIPNKETFDSLPSSEIIQTKSNQIQKEIENIENFNIGDVQESEINNFNRNQIDESNGEFGGTSHFDFATEDLRTEKEKEERDHSG